MFDAPELSPNLEWMLQSGQAGDSALIEAIADDYNAPVYRLALAWLGDGGLAAHVAQETITLAVMHAHRYRAEMGVRAWIFAQAVAACRKLSRRQRWRRIFTRQQPKASGEKLPEEWSAFDRLPEKQRLMLLLHDDHGLSQAEVAAALHLKETAVSEGLEQATRRLGERLAPDWLAALPQVAQERWPAPTPDECCKTVQEVEAYVTRRRKDWRLVLTAKEVVLGSVIIVLIAALGWVINLVDRQPPPPLPVRTVFVTRMITVPPPSTLSVSPATRAPATASPPLTIQSKPVEILQRMAESPTLWRTLWADAQIIYYGPPGYVGPPRVYRNQVWLRGDDQLVLYGPSGGKPTHLWLINGEGIFQSHLQSGAGTYTRYFYTQDDYLATPFAFETYDAYLSRMLFPAWLSLSHQPGWSEIVAGRETLVVDERMGRLWIDTQTGVILRERRTPYDPEITSVEVVVTDIVFDRDFPPEYFIPGRVTWPDEFTEGSGSQPPPQETIFLLVQTPAPGHERLVPLAPASDFDPSRSRLTFQWRSSRGYDDPGSSDNPTAQIIADGYLLGEAAIGDPFTLQCERSPDGMLIAVIAQPDIPFYGSQGIRWLSLAHPEDIHDPMPNGSAGSDLAFSPDSRTLAFFGCGGTDENCGVYLHDTQTGKNRKLLPMVVAGYFMFSPDGKSLAMVGAQSGEQMKLMVVSVDTAEVLFKSAIASGEISGIWPIDYEEVLQDEALEWSVPLRANTGGLEGCVNPPASEE